MIFPSHSLIDINKFDNFNGIPIYSSPILLQQIWSGSIEILQDIVNLSDIKITSRA
jgi:hypothetical protein